MLATREPGGSPIGERIRGMLIGNEFKGKMTSECEALLFAAARAQHTSEVLMPALNSGAIVLGDRYVDSSIAYQGWARRVGEDKVGVINDFATRGLKPDLTIVFDLSPEEAAMRRRKGRGEADDRIESEKIEFHHSVREGFLRIARAEPERVKVVDASPDEDTVFAGVKAIAMDALAKRAKSEA